VLFEKAFDELSAGLMSRDNRIGGVRLMFSDSLPRSEKAEYCVLITFNAEVSAKSAQLLTREIAQWRRESLKVAMKQERGNSRRQNARFPIRRMWLD
jgi:hypothetical protein